MKKNITIFPEFDNHELVMAIDDKPTGLHGFIAIHRHGPASLGATRLWNYASDEDALRDALRLSRLMSYKAAIAGFAYGGAKAALVLPKDGIRDRDRFFMAYAERINSLEGRFITGTDVGVTDADVKIMKQRTSYVIGSKLNPAYYTAIGVVEGIKVSLQHTFHSRSIKGRTFAIQGVGKVGSSVIRMIYNDAKKIVVTDLDRKKIAAIKKEFPRVVTVPLSAIYRQRVDVFVPCALSGILNEETIDQLKCKIIAGSANNQLARAKKIGISTGALLREHGILYAPDYIINIGGFVSVVDEFEHGKPDRKRILNKIDHMQRALGMIFQKADDDQKATNEIADRVAESLMQSRRSETAPVVIL